MGSLGVVSTSWWMQWESAQGESKTWGIILKIESALTVSCTSYQECGCHSKYEEHKEGNEWLNGVALGTFAHLKIFATWIKCCLVCGLFPVTMATDCHTLTCPSSLIPWTCFTILKSLDPSNQHRFLRFIQWYSQLSSRHHLLTSIYIT